MTHKIPTLAELHKDNPDAYANDQLKTLLNATPNMAWVKKHPFTGVPYIPVDKIEYMLDRVFGRWRREIKQVFQIENAVVAIVRLHYWNPSIARLDHQGYQIFGKDGEPIMGDWDYHDGTGAMPIQVESGSKASDMSQIKAAAIQLAAPAAASYALKDAADNLGKLFGRDITRKDTVAWDPSFKEDPFINGQTDGDKAPPPPPPLPTNLAAKIVEHKTPMDSTLGVLGGSKQATQQVADPVIDFTPPVFDASAFAAPIVNTQAEKEQPQPDENLNIPLNF
jgi:hypothetical protein